MTHRPNIACPDVYNKSPLLADGLSAPVFMQQGWLEMPEPDFLPAEIRVGWTPSHLVIRAEISDRDIFTRATASNQKMWELGDVFEIFLKTEERSDYVELHITPANLRLHMRFESPGKLATVLPDGVFSSAVEIDTANQKWTIHAEVPAALVSGRNHIEPGESWLFSFSRYDASRDDRPPILSSTSPHQVIKFHRIHEWGKMTFQTQR